MRAGLRSSDPKGPGSTWPGRLLRGLRPDRNPVRRRSDRAETALLGVLLSTFLAGAPLRHTPRGTWTYATFAREAQAQQAVSHQVQATLLQAAAPWSTEGYGSEVKARWQAPDGRVLTGEVLAAYGSAAGSTVAIWVSQTGRIAAVPLQRSQVEGRTQLFEALAVAVLAVAAIVLGLAGRWALDRRRLAEWDAEWLAAGTRWSPRQ